MTLIRCEKTVRTEGYNYRTPAEIRSRRYALAEDWNRARANVFDLGYLIPCDVRAVSDRFRFCVDEFVKAQRLYEEDPVDELWLRRTCRHGYPAERSAWSPDTDDAPSCVGYFVMPLPDQSQAEFMVR